MKKGAIGLTLWSAVAIVVLGLALLVQYPVTHFGSQFIGHFSGGVALVLSAATIHLMCARTSLAPAARRFWRWLECGSALMGLGFLVAGASLLARPVRLDETPRFPAFVIVLVLGGLAVYMLALLWLPVGARDRLDRIRLTIDGVTAILGGGAVLWYFAVHPILLRHPTGMAMSIVSIFASCLPAGCLATKIVLDNGGPIDRRALYLLGWSGACASISGILITVAPYVLAKLASSLVLLPLSAALVAAAAVRQLDKEPAPTGRQQPSVLPYLAVATVIALLLRVALDPIGWGGRVVVLAAVSITALVVLQQFVAIRENTGLLHNLRGQEERLQYAATHDSLTGLANRALFDERLRDAVATGRPVAVLLIDLDDFKTVNDTLGHGIGNDLLAAFAEIMRGVLRTGDLAARLGGDEFAILLDGEDVADLVVRRLLDALDAPMTAGNHLLLVNASVGVAVSRPADGPEDVLRNADIAMYEAKNRGKAGSVRYSPGMEEPVLAHMQLGGELHRALEHGEFFLVYQPIVLFKIDKIVGVEALVRWRHPTRGIVPPSEFIPVAEHTGLIVPLGRWVIQEATRQLAAWHEQYGPAAPGKVGCNVSARQLHDPGFAGEVSAALCDAGLDADRLVLELTESAALRGRRVLGTLDDLEARGIELALDDFGTGESSLSLLRSIPVSVIKLDKSFVDGIEAATPAGQAVARAVVQMAASLELEAVAEGVETQEQMRLLDEFGYELGQGFHFSRPLNPEQLGTLLADAGGLIRVRSFAQKQ